MNFPPYPYNLMPEPNNLQKNRFIYVKQDFLHPIPPPPPTKVLINPHFRKTVYVNPLFNPTTVSSIPSATSATSQKIHINPNVLRNFSSKIVTNNSNNNIEKPTTRIISTRNKFIRIQGDKLLNEKTPQRKRRISLHTKYKIIRTIPKVDQRIVKRTSSSINKFKLDKRTENSSVRKLKNKKKFVYVSRFLTIDIVAKNVLLKKPKNQSKFVEINGILYKKSPNSLKRQSDIKRNISMLSSKYKIIRKNWENNEKSRTKKRKSISKSKISNKLKKCNIPCGIYRKFGRCKGKENGSCAKVHNPDQIILCPRFLQGACHDDKCLLSHKVSYEKMPTCKYFLDGLCSKDNCPYLHVKISAKAEICRDFLAGFCKQGAECDQRHQFLCPDHEKSGNCVRIKCPYPHGNSVRSNQLLKFSNVKKCSKKSEKIHEKCLESNEIDKIEKNRYYVPDKKDNVDCDKICWIETVSRPKLGQLPSFIPFEEQQ